MRKSAVISLRLAKSNLHALLARLGYSTRIEILNIQKELGCHTLRAMTTSSSSRAQVGLLAKSDHVRAKCQQTSSYPLWLYGKATIILDPTSKIQINQYGQTKGSYRVFRYA